MYSLSRLNGFNSIILGLVGTVMVSASAQTLSDRSIYERCYMKLVRLTPQADDPFLAQIAAKTLTGPQACSQLLSLAALDPNSGRLSPYASEPAKLSLAQKILATMNDFHNSWFTMKNFEGADNPCYDRMTNGLLDPQTPALYITRALFSPSHDYASIVTATDTPRAIREVQNPARSIFGIDRNASPVAPATSLDFSVFPAGWQFAGNGKLNGIGVWGTLPMNMKVVTPISGDNPVLNQQDGRDHQGGGIVGSQAFLLNNFGENAKIVPDGEKLQRHWAKYIFTDLFCRDLPVINEADATPLRVSSSPMSFRRADSCVQCHASMDQLAGVVRNQRYFKGYSTSNSAGLCQLGMRYSSFHVVAQAQATLDKTWPSTPSAAYRTKQPFGRLYYRNFNNALVNDEVNGLTDLGNKLAAKRDLYNCAAKRYYQYFTGIDVDVSPVANVSALTPDQQFYRNRVLNLGARLQGTNTGNGEFNKSTKKLIEYIFTLPEYKSPDFYLTCKSQGSC